MHDCGALQILKDFSLTPHLLEERRQIIHEFGATVFVDLSRDRVRSGRFPAGGLLHGAGGFVGRGKEVEVDVGLHLRQTGDGGVGDGGGAIEDASEVLKSSL
ncbi:hypothetical protein SprV_0100143300 [Sparganum proliferum]